MSQCGRYGPLVKHILLTLALGLLACGGSQAHTDNSKLLAAGSQVPALVRADQNGQSVALRGGPATLLYFYPKDGTPGCTKEACAFRDAWTKYQTAAVRVIGVSTDSEEKHREFAKEHELPFPLIADPNREWADAFGVGRKFMVLDERVSFLIDKDGKVAKVYEDVDPGVHADQVLGDAKSLGLVN